MNDPTAAAREIPLLKLISDLKTHLANVEAFAVEAEQDGRKQPDLPDNPGPVHEHMFATIRRLGSGQCCVMSLRYLREVIWHLEHFPQPASGDGELDRAVDEAWLRSVGFRRFMQSASENSFSLLSLILRRYPKDKGWSVYIDGTHWPLKTRRDVLALMQALGIQSPKQPASGPERNEHD